MTLLADLVEQSSYDPGPQIATSLVVYVITVIGMWPTFRKAGVPGWWAIIPILNTYVLIKIAGYHGATILLFLIPIVNLIYGIVLAVKVANAFGHGGAFGFFLLWLLSPIGYLILGFGGSAYQGPDLARS
jgi:hypothetical protein